MPRTNMDRAEGVRCSLSAARVMLDSWATAKKARSCLKLKLEAAILELMARVYAADGSPQIQQIDCTIVQFISPHAGAGFD